jgi:iron(III) transport system ATP-binding protein
VGVGIPLDFVHEQVAAGPIRIAIRPEAISISPESGEGVQAQIVTRAYIGVGTEYSLTWHGTDLFVVVPAGGPVFQPGQSVELNFDPSGVAVIMEPT